MSLPNAAEQFLLHARKIDPAGLPSAQRPDYPTNLRGTAGYGICEIRAAGEVMITQPGVRTRQGRSHSTGSLRGWERLLQHAPTQFVARDRKCTALIHVVVGKTGTKRSSRNQHK